ncbi:hypothetical protein [Mycobacterium sp. PS03-16]|uniref:hypothetical protein n=1 Tax=Mycobacterium sp. PS03-16 TaxID=2559611 RepID=UPI0014311A23|nr:hypothetical protein [Mycobacterium sp. PS03-16]
MSTNPVGGSGARGGVAVAIPFSDPAGGMPTDGGVAVVIPLVEPAGGTPTDGGATFVRAVFAPGSASGMRPGTVSSCCMMLTHGTPGLTVTLGSAIADVGLKS